MILPAREEHNKSHSAALLIRPPVSTREYQREKLVRAWPDTTDEQRNRLIYHSITISASNVDSNESQTSKHFPTRDSRTLNRLPNPPLQALRRNLVQCNGRPTKRINPSLDCPSSIDCESNSSSPRFSIAIRALLIDPPGYMLRNTLPSRWEMKIEAG